MARRTVFRITAGMTAGAILLALPANFAAAVEWEAYTGISGVGAVTKNTPANTDHLHYSGHGVAEKATFYVTFNDAKDIDRCRPDPYTEWTPHTYTIGPAQVTWDCGKVEQGTIDATGEYTPPAAPRTGITITAFVDDENTGCTDDPDVERSYINALSAYRVGIAVSPASTTVWEDATDPDPVKYTATTDASKLEAYRTTTYWDKFEDGFYEDPADGWELSAKWKAVTDPADRDMVGKIQFVPRIDVHGGLYLRVWGECTGAGSTIDPDNLIAFAGASGGNPYVAAGALVLAMLVDSGCDVNMCVAGDSAIEFVDYKRIACGEVEGWHGTEWEWPGEEYASIMDVSVNGTITRDTNEEIRGSCKIAAKVSIRDASWWEEGGGHIDATPGGTYYLKYGTSIPEYLPSGE